MIGTVLIDTKDLKPCPFCGYKGTRSPLIIKERDYDINSRDDEEEAARNCYAWYCAVCLKCKSKTGEYSKKEKAIEAWNNRMKD